MAAISIGAGTAIAAGIGAVSGGSQIYAAGKMNKKTREWNEKMYGVQREDALRDWHMQNEYNSPAAQMARYKAAGLNPNLIYGNMDSGASVRSTDVKSWNPQTPDFRGISQAAIEGLGAYQDYTLQQETVKNMEAQRRNMNLDASLKAIEAFGKEISNRQSLLDYAKSHRLFDTAISTAEEQLRSIKTGTDLHIAQSVRDAAKDAASITEAFERISKLRADTQVSRQQLDNLKKSGILQQLDINLKKLGVQPTDHVIMRALSQFLNGDTSGAIKGIVDQFPDMDLDDAAEIHKKVFSPFKGMFFRSK